MLITNVSEQDQCEIPAASEAVLAAPLCVSASLMWKVKPAARGGDAPPILKLRSDVLNK